MSNRRWDVGTRLGDMFAGDSICLLRVVCQGQHKARTEVWGNQTSFRIQSMRARSALVEPTNIEDDNGAGHLDIGVLVFQI